MSKNENDKLLELQQRKKKYTDEEQHQAVKKPNMRPSTAENVWIESNINEYRKINKDDGGSEYSLESCQCYGEIEFEDVETFSNVSTMRYCLITCPLFHP